MTIPTNFSMMLLPDQPMMPRHCDNRVGYFSVTYEDFGAPDARIPTRCVITRWRLEPKDPAAAVSDPIKPIVFYIDPATPEQWVPWLIKGVEMWEPVFRAAGFSDAILRTGGVPLHREAWGAAWNPPATPYVYVTVYMN